MSTDPDGQREGITVEVVYGLPERQSLLKLTVPGKTTVMQAIDLSGIRDLFPEMEITQVGIFSRKVTLDHVLEDGDRVEIYRPLIASPQEMRKKRAMK
ncbi:RnfH family protein [Pseudomonadota bacterium]